MESDRVAWFGPDQQMLVLDELLAAIDEAVLDGGAPSAPPPAVNACASTLWCELQDGQLAGADERTEKLVVRIYATFDRLLEGEGGASHRLRLYSDMRKSAVRLRAHLQQRG